MKLKITIDNKNYDVDVEIAETENFGSRLHAVESAVARTPIAATAARTAETAVANEEKVCRSPVSGIVASVTAQVGQSLQAGDALLVLEAMKMETQVTAHVAGKVTAIKVKAGDSVQSGQILVEFE
jgi:methylmalonyl-CoA carboxyltransferase small subunit